MNGELTLANQIEKVNSIFDSLDVRDRTRYEYKHRIKHFLLFLNQNGFELNTLLDYKRSLAANELYSISTKNKYLACARIFLKEAYRIGLLPRDVTSNVKCFQQSKRHKVDGINDIEATAIVEWMKQHPDNQRESALLAILLFQGLRQAEICNLQKTDVNIKARTMLVLGKGRDDKEKVYLHPKTATYLGRYMRSIKQSECDYIFTSRRAKSQNDRLTERGLQKIVKKVLDEIEISKSVHGFRHFYTTRLIRTMPGELITVARFTRHRSIQMLEVYNDSLLEQKDLAKYYTAFQL